jgi:hypothetical protein
LIGEIQKKPATVIQLNSIYYQQKKRGGGGEEEEEEEYKCNFIYVTCFILTRDQLPVVVVFSSSSLLHFLIIDGNSINVRTLLSLYCICLFANKKKTY